MEAETRFNLSDAVESWRRHVASTTALDAESLRELQEHLLDSTAHLKQCGLKESEAFLIARRRLGMPARLDEEYQTGDPTAVWRQRMRWIVGGVALTNLWGSLNMPVARLTPNFFGESWNESSANIFLHLWFLAVSLTPLLLAMLPVSGRILGRVDFTGTILRNRRHLAWGIPLVMGLALGGSQYLMLWRGPNSNFPALEFVVGFAVLRGAALGAMTFLLIPKSGTCPSPAIS